MNRLAGEKSAYLRHAAHQRIDWYPWCEEAFERASAEGKPVFLSSGAVWCHWCHVMAKESFEDEEVAALLNRHFIAVKLDRDERPDLDRRYQRAVSAMGFGGGWPLSVFLTPDKRPFYGGTYFPPSDRFGRPGFKTILAAISDAYRTKKEEIEENSRRMVEFLGRQASTEGMFTKCQLVAETATILGEADRRNGGFGEAPKFPMSGTLEFLLGRYFLTRDEEIRDVLTRTLRAMARGGIHDHLGGGFHRYSTDALWIMPHFEKMTDDNAWLLRNYADAYAILGDPRYREVAEGIAGYMTDEMTDPEGGFYASQDADVTADDEGGYFTWTDADLKRVLDDDEYRVITTYLFHLRGAMHHDGAKRVLFAQKEKDEAAKDLGLGIAAMDELLKNARTKLLAERNSRERPFVDTALYTNLNGMTISAFLRAYRVLRDESMKTVAIKSLQRVLEENVEDGILLHGNGVKALFEDYANLADALVGAYEVTGEEGYLVHARWFMDDALAKFWDTERGGFFDTDEEVIGIRLKGIEDVPHPSANSVAAVVLVRLAHITGEERYLHHAGEVLKTFALAAGNMGVHAGYYWYAVEAYFSMIKLDVAANPGSELAAAALHTYHPLSVIVYGDDKGVIVPCVGNTCYAPVRNAEELRTFFEGIG